MLILKTILVTEYIMYVSIMYNEIKKRQDSATPKTSFSSVVDSPLAWLLPVLMGLSPGENF